MTRHADDSAARRTRLAPRRTGSIAERLAYLFDVVHAPGTRGYTAAEVARGVRAAGGSISDVYINKLLNGQRGEPSLRYLRMLAGFFGVPLTFFLDDDPGPIDGPGLDLQIRLRSPQVQAMLAAAGRLPEPGAVRAGRHRQQPAARRGPRTRCRARRSRQHGAGVDRLGGTAVPGVGCRRGRHHRQTRCRRHRRAIRRPDRPVPHPAAPSFHPWSGAPDGL